MELVTLAMITVVGTAGNILILAATWRHKRPLSVMNLLLASQCASDLVLTLFNPFIMVTRYTRHWVLGDVMCRVINYMQFATAATSILCMTCLAVDHYLLVCRPHSATRHALKRHVLKLLLLTWVVPLVWFSPFLLIWRVKSLRQGGVEYTWCYFIWPVGFNNLVFVVLTGLCMLVIPIIVVTVCHTTVFLTVRRSGRRVAAASTVPLPPISLPPITTTTTTTITTTTNSMVVPQWEKRQRVERKLLKMLAVSVIVFVLLWLPFFVFSILVIFVDLITSTHYLFFVILSFCNPCINPALIVYFNGHYRYHVRRLLP